MPTGYTADVIDKNISFEQFVWDCARAFGALIHMRDDGHGARIRKEEPRSYHRDALVEAQADLKRLKAMTDAEADRLAQAEHERRLAEDREARAQAAKNAARLNAMIAKVEAWQPPSKDHQGLKKFMLEQLQETLKWDGSYDGEFMAPLLVSKTGAQYREAAIKTALDSIEYHGKHMKEDAERDSGRGAWIDQLQASVPYPAGRI